MNENSKIQTYIRMKWNEKIYTFFSVLNSVSDFFESQIDVEWTMDVKTIIGTTRWCWMLKNTSHRNDKMRLCLPPIFNTLAHCVRKHGSAQHTHTQSGPWWWDARRARCVCADNSWSRQSVCLYTLLPGHSLTPPFPLIVCVCVLPHWANNARTAKAIAIAWWTECDWTE